SLRPTAEFTIFAGDLLSTLRAEALQSRLIASLTHPNLRPSIPPFCRPCQYPDRFGYWQQAKTEPGRAVSPMSASDGFPAVGARSSASRQTLHPLLQVLGTVSHQSANFDESRAALHQTPSSGRSETHLDLFGDFL